MPKHHIMCGRFEVFNKCYAVRLFLWEEEISAKIAVARCKVIGKIRMPARHLCLKQYCLRCSRNLKINTAGCSVFDVITINHKVTEQLVNGKYVPVVSDVMKNKTSCRTLPLIPAVEEELLKQKEKQQLYRKLFKKSYSTEYLDFVCTDQEGKLIRPNFVTEHFDWLLTKYGLKHIRFHDLRHSCASLMVMNGVSMKQVQEWLGHSTFSTTADIYAHLDYKSKQGSAGVIANLLGESKLPK